MPTIIDGETVTHLCDYCGAPNSHPRTKIGLFYLNGPPRCEDCQGVQHRFGFNHAGRSVFLAEDQQRVAKAMARVGMSPSWHDSQADPENAA